MAVETHIYADVRLRDAVRHQFDWEPSFDSSEIGVTARDGVVTLTGFVETYVAKLAAERAVKRVHGVLGVANDLAVRATGGLTDADIAREVVHALALRPTLAHRIQPVVHHGHVTLTGTVQWLYQKHEAEAAVRYTPGMVGLFNHIDVKPEAECRDVRRRVSRALHRIADVDAHRIAVTVDGDTVTLSGTVGSWAQRDAAEQAATNAPGISLVRNEVVVVPAESQRHEDLDEIC